MSNKQYNIGLVAILLFVLALTIFRASHTFDMSEYSKSDYIAPGFRMMPITEISGSSAFLKKEEFNQFFSNGDEIYDILLYQLHTANRTTDNYWKKLQNNFETYERDSAMLFLVQELFDLSDSTFLTHNSGKKHSKIYFLPKTNNQNIDLKTDTLHSYKFDLTQRNEFPLPEITAIKNIDGFLIEYYNSKTISDSMN